MGGRVLLLSAGWLALSLPLITWMAASAALLHALDRSAGQGAADVPGELWQGWRRHWRTAVPLGTVALAVLVALVANLLFLTGQGGPVAFLLLVGTLLLLALWAMSMLSLVPVLVLLPDLPRRAAVRVGVLLAFRRPARTAGLALLALLLVTALGEVWVPLGVLAAPVVGHLSLALARRHLREAL